MKNSMPSVSLALESMSITFKELVKNYKLGEGLHIARVL